MLNTILGNITSLIANLLDAFSSTRKTRKEMMLVQIFSCLVYAVTNLLFKTYSAVIQNLCALVRNILAAKEIESKKAEYVIVLLALIMGIYFNNLGLVGLLPVFANVEYSICLFVLKDNVRAIKYSYLVCNTCFLILNIFIKNYVGFIFTFITVTTETVDLIKNK